MESVRSGAYVPGLALAEDAHVPDVPVDHLVSDTMMIKDADGKDLIIMKAVRDENGDMVASDVIVPSVVVATFRNVAERQGVVDLRFDISIPADLADSHWQLRIRKVCPFRGRDSDGYILLHPQKRAGTVPETEYARTLRFPPGQFQRKRRAVDERLRHFG